VSGAQTKMASSQHLSSLARQTFYNLLILTALSLIAVGPLATIQSIGGFLVLASVIGVVTCAKGLLAERETEKSEKRKSTFVRAYYAPLFIFFFLLGAGLEMTNGHKEYITFGAWGSLMLIVSSARNAWALLVDATS